MFDSTINLISDLRSGSYYGIFIDDTGSPGTPTNSSLHPERKTWVAVVVPPHLVPEVMQQMPEGISELKRITGATEFHFSDIYTGNRQFKGVSIDLRDSLIKFMGFVFDTYDLKILIQTCDPTHVEKWLQNEDIDLSPHFRLDNHEHLALLFLLSKVKHFLGKSTNPPNTNAVVVIDAGLKNSGTCMSIPSLGDRFVKNLICFADSSVILPIQLADFAAWWLNRMQLIIDRKNLSAREEDLLMVLEHMASRYSDTRVLPLDFDGESADED